MKTQVIHLDPHDDLISIRDRMEWAKSPRILLVWPKRGRVEVRPLDLTLLRRRATALGAELGIVSREGEIRAAARELGLPIFSSAAKAQKKPWVSHKPPVVLERPALRRDLRALRRDLEAPQLFPWLRQPVFRLSIFVLGLLAVLAVVLIFIPSAEVVVQLPEQKQSLELAVSADPDVEKVQISGLIPARRLTLVLTGTANALATGKISTPDQTATGTCLFTNLTSKPVSLPAGTLVTTSATPVVTFVTVAPVDLPAKKGSSASAAVRAQAAGIGGNLPGAALNRLDGALGQSVTVTNPNPTSGGTEAQLAQATDQDRESLRKRLLGDLEREARGQFAPKISAGDVLFPETLTRLQVLEEHLTPLPGQPGAKLSLTLKVEFGMSFAAAADLQELAQRVLNASLPAGFSPVPGPIELKPASKLTLSQGRVYWQVRAARAIRSAVDPGEVISIVAGKTVQGAARQLTETYQLQQPPQIRILPGWWPWLPFLPLRIAVTG